MHRRDLIRLGAATVAAGLKPAVLSALPPNKQSSASASNVEQWGIFELSLAGPTAGNPYKDVTLTARFTMEHRSVQVTGFYDGEGTYRVRFMPDTQGQWSYETQSSARALAGHTGEFVCTPPSTLGNRGPVGTAHQFHFQYADGTPYFPFGTTTYAYLFTADTNAKASLTGMQVARFNKSRVCVLPKPLGSGTQILPYLSTGCGRGWQRRHEPI